MGQRDPKQRITRVCDVCGQVDDHPHVIHPMPDGSVLDRHHDCCAERGCPTGVCNAVAATGKTGDELLKHLTKRKGGK